MSAVLDSAFVHVIEVYVSLASEISRLCWKRWVYVIDKFRLQFAFAVMIFDSVSVCRLRD